MTNTLLHPRRLNPRKHLLSALIFHRVHPATHRGARRHPGLVLTSIGDIHSAQQISSARPHSPAHKSAPKHVSSISLHLAQAPGQGSGPDNGQRRKKYHNLTPSTRARPIPIPILARVSTSGLLKVCRRVAAPPEPREQGRDISTLLHSIHCMHNPNRRANNYQTNHQYYYNTIPRTQNSLTPCRKV